MATTVGVLVKTLIGVFTGIAVGVTTGLGVGEDEVDRARGRMAYSAATRVDPTIRKEMLVESKAVWWKTRSPSTRHRLKGQVLGRDGCSLKQSQMPVGTSKTSLEDVMRLVFVLEPSRTWSVTIPSSVPESAVIVRTTFSRWDRSTLQAYSIMTLFPDVGQTGSAHRGPVPRWDQSSRVPYRALHVSPGSDSPSTTPE